MIKTNPFPFAGLKEQEVNNSRKKIGINKIEPNPKSSFWHSLKDAVTG